MSAGALGQSVGGPTEAELEDLALIAEADEVSLDEAIADHGGQTEFNAAGQKMYEEYPEAFAASGFDAEGRPYLLFKGEPPAAARELIADFPDLDLSGGARFSEDELTELNDAAFFAVADALPEGSMATAAPDPLTGTVALDISSSGDLAAANSAVADLEPGTDISATFGELELHDIVNIRIDESLSSTTEAINGGDKLTEIGSGPYFCTAGFPATYGSLSGLTTAKHCRNDLDVDFKDLIYNASVFTSNSDGDLQWHRAKTTVNSQFRYDWGSYRPVWANVKPSGGTSVCRFGASSGSDCSSIYQINVCNTYSSGDTYCGLIRTHRYTGSRDGDSGGPWYYGNNAYGVHSGSGWYYGIKRNLFTSTYYGLPDAGLKIKLASR